MTVGLDYLAVPVVPKKFLWTFLSISLMVYYGCLYWNGVYSRRKGIRSLDYGWLVLIFIIGIAIAFGLRRSDLGIICGLALASLGQCGYLLFRLQPQR